MMQGIFGRVIGRTAALHEGHNAIYLPQGMDEGFAAAVVREANLARNAGNPPYAILVDDDGSVRTEGVKRVSRAEAIGYRQGDRLAVIPATSVDIASFEGVFREAIGPAFPGTAAVGFSVDSLAKTAAALLVEAHGGDPTLIDPQPLQEALRTCMTWAANLLAEERDGAASWNRAWYALVDRALALLHSGWHTEQPEDTDISIPALLSHRAWAAFGLPTPLVPEDGLRVKPEQMIQGFEDYWSSEGRIEVFTKETLVAAGSAADALNACWLVGWTGLDEHVAREPSALSGFQTFISQNPALAEAFTRVTQDAFMGRHLLRSKAVLLDDQGTDLSFTTGAERPMYFVESSSIDAGTIQSPPITLAIQPSNHVPDEAVTSSTASVRVEGASAAVVDASSPHNASDGRIHFTFKIELKRKPVMRKVVLTIELPGDDSLLGYVERESLVLYFVPPTNGGLIVSEWTSAQKKQIRNPRFDGMSSGGESGQDHHVEVKADTYHRVMVHSTGDAPSTQTIKLSPAQREGWWYGDIPPNHHTVITLGDNEWTLDPGTRGGAHQSLLRAAIAGVNPDPGDPDETVLQSIRGRLETVIGEGAGRDDMLAGLCHLILPADSPVRADSFSLNGAVLVPEDDEFVRPFPAEEKAPTTAWVAAHQDFIESWKACLELLEVVPRDGAGVSTAWPSKRSAAVLATERSDLLDELLLSYQRLVDASQDETPLRRLASYYPFSASVWTLKSQHPTCDALLLSPWHPIRLAWLANAEQALRCTPRADSLAGTIEGWRFPLIGPALGKYGRMIAVPIDAGSDDIFSAWSMMVPISADPAVLKSPTSIGGHAPPGNSASGLTGSAADAAMRDFRRVNQHLPSITIELASSTVTQRLEELDRSVVRAVQQWSRAGSSLQGIRILDSLNRLGDIPREAVTELLLNGLPTSLSWSRYQPTKGLPTRSNLRLLQDSGVVLGNPPVPASSNGVLGDIPLRRFEGPARHDIDYMELQPSVATQQRGAFVRALAAIEQPGGRAPKISVTMTSAQLLDDGADWTISGQSYVSASLLAAILSDAQSTRELPKMLWEWRPPFLSPDAASPLNRRPYASVIRVGNQLTSNISDWVKVLDPRSQTGAAAVLRTLGAQGIGLSSLVSMGGNNATGALGFYLSLRLMECAQPSEDWVQVVMPIDACREFLNALAPGTDSSDTRRQADLLIVRASDKEVCLIPLEVKMRGLDSHPVPDLPGPSDFADPLAQLQSTVALLELIQNERRRISVNGSGMEAALWDNALATLLEAGLALTGANASKIELATTVLNAVVSGDYRLTIGRPLITYYQHLQGAVDQYKTYKQGHLATHDAATAYAALAARPGTVWQAVSGPNPSPAGESLIKAWSDLVNWAHVHAVSASNAAASGDAEQDTPTDPASVVPDHEALDEDQPSSQTQEVAQRGSPSQSAESLRSGGGKGHHREGVGTGATGDGASPASTLIDGRTSPERPETEQPSGGARLGSVGVRVPVGHLLDSPRRPEVDYWPGNTQTTQLNVGIVGDQGTGKTQLVKALLRGLRDSSYAVQEEPVSGLIFDYKSDFQDEDFRQSLGATLWTPYDIPLNVLDLYEPYSRQAAYRRASGFASMLDRIYSGIGPVQRNRLIQVILDLFEEDGGQPPTLRRVADRYGNGVPSDAVTSVLNNFVLPRIFSEDGRSTTIEEAMKDTILILDLNSWGADHQMKNSLVVLFLDMFYEAMKRSEKKPFTTTSDGITLRQLRSYLLVDEASNIMAYDFPVLESLLKEGREFGVGTILSSQYLSHFKSRKTNYAEALSTWFIHKVPNVTPAELSTLGIVGADRSMAERIKTLRLHQSLYKSDLNGAQFISEIPYWRLAD